MSDRMTRSQVATQLRQEAAYEDWAGGMKIADIAERYEVSVKTIENWRAKGKWTQRTMIAKLEHMQGDRERADASLSEAMPEVMRHAVDLALGKTDQKVYAFDKDFNIVERNADVPFSVQAQMTKYLLGTLGYSPEASSQWLQAVEAKLAQAKDQLAAQKQGEDREKDFSTIFSEAIDAGAIPGRYEPNESNGPDPAKDDPLDDTVWSDDR